MLTKGGDRLGDDGDRECSFPVQVKFGWALIKKIFLPNSYQVPGTWILPRFQQFHLAYVGQGKVLSWSLGSSAPRCEILAYLFIYL